MFLCFAVKTYLCIFDEIIKKATPCRAKQLGIANFSNIESIKL